MIDEENSSKLCACHKWKFSGEHFPRNLSLKILSFPVLLKKILFGAPNYLCATSQCADCPIQEHEHELQHFVLFVCNFCHRPERQQSQDLKMPKSAFTVCEEQTRLCDAISCNVGGRD